MWWSQPYWPVVAAFAACGALLGLVLLYRAGRNNASAQFDLLLELMQEELKDLRAENALLAGQHRQETLTALGEFSRQSADVISRLGDAQAARVTALEQATGTRLESMTAAMDRRQQQLAASVEALQRLTAGQLHAFQQGVENQLQGRLGDGFERINSQLGEVNKGLGEMRQLAGQVADLKGALTNVKTRGLWGERQLETLLATFLAPGQFEKQMLVGDGAQRVDFAVKVPAEAPLWMPIDAKFPLEPFHRLRDAVEAGDAVAVAKARKELRVALKTQALSVADKYIRPPFTVDFALVFLPGEGLYAEALADDGLVDELASKRVIFAGPNTLCALLSSLQLGFRALALARRGSELWDALAAVRREFAKFHDQVDRAGAQVATLAKGLEETGRRARAMERRLLAAEKLGVLERPGQSGAVGDLLQGPESNDSGQK